MTSTQSHSSLSREIFPIIASTISKEEITDKVDAHLSMLAAEKDRLVTLVNFLQPSERNDSKEAKHQRKSQHVVRRNANKSKTTLVSLSYAKNFFRTERKTKSIQTPIDPSHQQSLFSFQRSQNKARTLNATSSSKAKQLKGLIQDIISQEKKTNETAVKLSLELTSLKKKRYLSEDRFKLKSTVDDHTLFKLMYQEDQAKKAYVCDLKGDEMHLNPCRYQTIPPCRAFGMISKEGNDIQIERQLRITKEYQLNTKGISDVQEKLRKRYCSPSFQPLTRCVNI